MKDSLLLRYTEVFKHVAMAGGIQAAAKQMPLSAPAIHHAISRLQQMLGYRLFDKVGRQLVLNAKGQKYLQACTRLLDDFARARDQLRHIDADHQLIRLGVVSGFGRYRLAPALFKQLPDNTNVELRFAPHEDLLQRLRLGQLDAVVSYRPTTEAGIFCESVAKETLVLVTPPSLTITRQRRWHQLQQQSWVTYDEFEYVFGYWFDHILKRQPESLHRADHCTELEEALEAVCCGRGITIAPRDAADAERYQKRLRISSTGACTNQIYCMGIASQFGKFAHHLVRTVLRKR
jgi:DNA-binding transcriptional LysR family regulator